MFCPTCGVQIKENARFCNACGAPVPSRNPASEALGLSNASDAANANADVNANAPAQGFPATSPLQRRAATKAPRKGGPGFPVNKKGIAAVIAVLLAIVIAVAFIYGFFTSFASTTQSLASFEPLAAGMGTAVYMISFWAPVVLALCVIAAAIASLRKAEAKVKGVLFPAVLTLILCAFLIICYFIFLRVDTGELAWAVSVVLGDCLLWAIVGAASSLLTVVALVALHAQKNQQQNA